MIRSLLTSALLFGASMAQADLLDEAVSLNVLPGWRTADGQHRAAMQFVLGDGWKTYWRAPGDAGIPPAFSWSGSRNVAGVEFHWTVPEIQDQNGFRVLGYSNQMVLPMDVALENPDASALLDGSVQIGVCREICVPVTLSFSVELPAAGKRDGAIMGAMLAQPMTSDEAEVQTATCSMRPIDDGMELTAELVMPRIGKREVGVIEVASAGLWVSQADYTRQGDRVTLQVDVLHPEGLPVVLDRSRIRITVLTDGQAVDVQGCGAT